MTRRRARRSYLADSDSPAAADALASRHPHFSPLLPAQAPPPRAHRPFPGHNGGEGSRCMPGRRRTCEGKSAPPREQARQRKGRGGGVGCALKGPGTPAAQLYFFTKNGKSEARLLPPHPNSVVTQYLSSPASWGGGGKQGPLQPTQDPQILGKPEGSEQQHPEGSLPLLAASEVTELPP